MHRQYIDKYTRDIMWHKTNKWKDFRMAKAEVVDKYLKAKRQSMAMRELSKQILLFRMLQRYKNALNLEKDHRLFKMRSCRMALTMYIKLGKA